MTKKVITLFVLCLMLFSLLAMAFNVQSTKAQYGTSIPAGRNVSVYLNGVHLQFDFVVTPGIVTAYQLEIGPAAVSLTIDSFQKVWNVSVTARFIGQVKVGLDYGDLYDTPTQIWQTDGDDSGHVLGDVNKDGKVNCADLLLVIKALGSSPSSSRWNQCYDLNHDGKINLQDLCIVSQNLGKTAYWIDITKNVPSANHIVWGVTDHFSLFGVR